VSALERPSCLGFDDTLKTALDGFPNSPFLNVLSDSEVTPRQVRVFEHEEKSIVMR